MELSVFADVLDASFDAALDKAAGIGLRAVDLRTKLDGHTVDTIDTPGVARIAAQLERRGFSAASIASWGVNPISGDYDPRDPDYRRRMKERVQHLAELARNLNSQNVRVYSFKRPPQSSVVTDADYASNAAFLSELADIAAKSGRTLVIENEPPNLSATCKEMGDLMRRSGHPALRINWDIVNGWTAGEIPWKGDVFNAIAGYVAHVHIKGARANADGSFASMALPGADDVPHAELVRKLWRSGYRGYLSIDPHYHQFAEADKLSGVADATLEVVRRTHRYFTKLIADIKQESQRGEPSCAPVSNQAAPCEKYPWGDIRWPASRAACGARELTLGVTHVAPGASNPVHRHPNCEEVLVVIRGEIEHYIEGTPRVRMKAGETIVIPRNRRHQARNAGATEAELLVAFSSAERETVIDQA